MSKERKKNQTKYSFSPSLLKSAIQKTIRRGNATQAAKCTYLLLNRDPNQFWRRLPIIILEDVVLHPDLEKIVRLARISARKSYSNNARDTEFALGIVEQLARAPWRDTEYIRNKEFWSETTIESHKKLNIEKRELVEAISNRASLGGMKGDVEMLKIFEKIWMDRFSNGSMTVRCLEYYLPKSQSYVKKNEVKVPPTPADIPIEAVDFHCSPLVPVLLKKKKVNRLLNSIFGIESHEEKEKKLKDIIWRMRSGVNFKADWVSMEMLDWLELSEKNRFDPAEREKYELFYREIEEDVEGISQWFLESRILRSKQKELDL